MTPYSVLGVGGSADKSNKIAIDARKKTTVKIFNSKRGKRKIGKKKFYFDSNTIPK
jgi:hypothetical protein